MLPNERVLVQTRILHLILEIETHALAEIHKSKNPWDAETSFLQSRNVHKSLSLELLELAELRHSLIVEFEDLSKIRLAASSDFVLNLHPKKAFEPMLSILWDLYAATRKF